MIVGYPPLADPAKVLNLRTKRLDGMSYKLAGGQYGLDVAVGEPEVDETNKAVVIPFADGNRRDGVGDLLEVGGIDCSRHVRNPVVLFDHGKQVTLPVALAQDPHTGAYTVAIDPVSKVATAKCFFYQSGTVGYEHALFCDQLFDLIARKFIRAGSIGYQVKQAAHLSPNRETGTPQGLHLLSVLLLEVSAVVMPANADTVRKALALPSLCGKPLCGYLVKSLSPYAEEVKAVEQSGFTAGGEKGGSRLAYLRSQSKPQHDDHVVTHRLSENQAAMAARMEERRQRRMSTPPRPPKPATQQVVSAMTEHVQKVRAERPEWFAQNTRPAGKSIKELRSKYRKKSTEGPWQVTRDTVDRPDSWVVYHAKHPTAEPVSRHTSRDEAQTAASRMNTEHRGKQGQKSIQVNYRNRIVKGFTEVRLKFTTAHMSLKSQNALIGAMEKAGFGRPTTRGKITRGPRGSRLHKPVRDVTYLLSIPPPGKDMNDETPGLMTKAIGIATKHGARLLGTQRPTGVKAMPTEPEAEYDTSETQGSPEVEGTEGETPEEEKPTEFLSAQVLRRLHEDDTHRMREYDEWLNHLEHDDVRAHVERRLEDIARHLDENEALMKEHHPDLPGLDGSDEKDLDDDVGPEGDDEGEVGDATEEPEAEEEAGGEATAEAPGGEEEQVSGDADTMDDAAVGADSAQDEETDPDDVVEGMENDPRKKKEEKSLALTRAKYKKKSQTVTPPAVAVKELCPICGKDPCECEGGPGDVGAKIGPVAAAAIGGIAGALSPKDLGMVREGSGFLGELAAPGSVFDDEHRMKSYHYHKTFAGMVQLEEAHDKVESNENTVPPAEWEPGAGARKDHGDVDYLEGSRLDNQEPDTAPKQGDWKDTVNGASDWFRVLSTTKDFGDPHRKNCGMMHKALQGLGLEEKEEEATEESIGGSGDTDVKSLLDLLNGRQKHMDELGARLAQLAGGLN